MTLLRRYWKGLAAAVVGAAAGAGAAFAVACSGSTCVQSDPWFMSVVGALLGLTFVPPSRHLAPDPEDDRGR